MLVHWITTDGGLGTARWLSWFPLTAPVTVLLRLGNGTIGPIEIVSALAFTWIFSAIALAAGARLFRAVVLGRSG
jgi:ABC-type Na+ efflux pump permease subunit